jgi:hypothetical protein
VAAGPDGTSVVLVQQWRRLPSWEAPPVADQERVIGRTKDDSIELADDVMPQGSHVWRTVVEEGGQELEIYRHNTSYGDANDHGTMFVAFCATQRPLALMLDRMAGHGDGIRPHPACRSAHRGVLRGALCRGAAGASRRMTRPWSGSTGQPASRWAGPLSRQRCRSAGPIRVSNGHRESSHLEARWAQLRCGVRAAATSPRTSSPVSAS